MKSFYKQRLISADLAPQPEMVQCDNLEKVNMRKIVLVAALLTLAGSAHASDEPVLLYGKELRAAVSGKTIYIQTPIGAEIPIRYLPNGTMTGASSVQLAALAGEQVSTDKGRWWVRRAELCQQWNKWSNGRPHCYSFMLPVRVVRLEPQRRRIRHGSPRKLRPASREKRVLVPIAIETEHALCRAPRQHPPCPAMRCDMCRTGAPT